MAVRNPPKSKKTRHDDSVMTTNNSSIVSKRSVERIYYQEPHFYRYFVKKPLRRSPLINRGYWLRMHAIDQIVRQFLEYPSEKHKLVLNLGCGYDPLPFQWLSKDPSLCQGCRFIDVDFPKLMAKKSDVVVNTSQLRDLVGPCERPPDYSGVFLRSEVYLALGCDLGNITRLEELLAREVDTSNSLMLCTAEVSVTYMDTEAADALIHWAAQYNDIRFCLLEQYLPGSARHPFAQKMVQHFNNLQTPLKSIHVYPQLADQERRFLKSGWSAAVAKSLWDIWNDPTMVSIDHRLALNDMEPFDEWEEFVLFASHYLLLVADQGPLMQGSSISRPLRKQSFDILDNLAKNTLMAHSEAIPESNIRRFGAAITFSPHTIGYHGGLGPQSRVSSTDVYVLPGAEPQDPPDVAGIGPRMCHTITACDHGSLLVGGRTSPDHALRDCWMLREARWERVEDLPRPLYRHCATQVTLGTENHGVLVYGGKAKGNDVSDQWLLWRASIGWEQVLANDYKIGSRFGATMTSIGNRNGILLGGMTADGTILEEFWEWTLNYSKSTPIIGLSKGKISRQGLRNPIGRIGACLTMSHTGPLLIGGVSPDILAKRHDIVCLSKGKSEDEPTSEWQWTPVKSRTSGQRPLLVGHSTFTSHQFVTIVGGGAVCFSFGTYWNTEIITLSTSNVQGFSAMKPNRWKGENSSHKQPVNNSINECISAQHFQMHNNTVAIAKTHLKSSKDFEEVLNQRLPIVFTAPNLGRCTREWTLDTLKAKIGRDRVVVVHEASNTQMDFQTKNFAYSKKNLHVFFDEVAQGSRQYLRSLAFEKPAEQPANFWADYPDLASDFVLPPELEMVSQNTHSSVLRISGPVNMWLHYDVMANVLCQIRGTKRLILYPPSDVSLLSIPPGTSSSSINCFDPNSTEKLALASAHPYEALLEPGDILFIPPLWLHAASPMDKVSISVNVFFRDLETGYAPGRDVYGNRDVQAYEKGRKDIEKITKSFHKLPGDMVKFYLERLADELKEKALHYGS